MQNHDALNILARIESADNKPKDEELSTALDDLKSALDAATSDDNPDLEVARDIREAINTVTAEQTARAEALEVARAEARKLREGILDTADGDTTDDTAEEVEKDEPAVTAKEAEPVAAAPKINVIERLRAHAAARTPNTDVRNIPGVEIAALGPASGFDIDADATIADLGRLFSQHSKSITARGQSSPLFRITRHYDETRTLGNNVDQNNARLAALFGAGLGSPEAAAGGLCGPDG